MGEWVAWTPDLLVGVQKIDDQHEELFRRFNLLGDALWEGKGTEEVGKMLDFVADYVVTHFADEEALMLKHDYPKLETHKQVHEAFVSEVNKTITEYKNGNNSSEFVAAIVNRLGDWTREHIKKMDQEIKGYL
jgi:hemerythrin